MRNLWKDLQKLEQKCLTRPVFRSISGNVVVCDPELARSCLAGTDHYLFRRPSFWRAGGEVLPKAVQQSLDHWVISRLAHQDPEKAAHDAAAQIAQTVGDLHHVCMQATITGLAMPLGCATDPALERAVRDFFTDIFVPVVLGRLDRRTNIARFKEASHSVGRLLRTTERDVLPDVFDGRAAEDPSLAGELYLRSTAAFIAAAGLSLAWLLTVLFAETSRDGQPAADRAALRELPPEWVALEALRLYPPVWQHRRSLMEERRIGPLLALKEDDLQIPVYVIHRHPDYWAQASEFIPNRWRDRSRQSLLGFSAGPGACIGSRFAVTWLASAAAALLTMDGLRLTPLGRHPHVTTSFSPPLAHLG